MAAVPDGGSPPSDRAAIADIENCLRHFETTTVSAKAATEAAEAMLDDATIVDVGFDVQNDRPVYRATAEFKGHFIDVLIDASSKAVAQSPALPNSSEEDRLKVSRFKRLGLKLSEAISIGETYGSGRAVSASLDQSHGRVVILVVVVFEGYLKQISIDPTGEAERRKGSSMSDPIERAMTRRQTARPPVTIR